MCDSNNENLVTDFVQELSSTLQIPFLLGESEVIAQVPNDVDSLDSTFYTAAIQHVGGLGSVYDYNSNSNCYPQLEDLNSLKTETEVDLGQFTISDELMRISTDSSCSGNGSGSECSSTELWPHKSDLDTPPVTPPEERTSPESFFIYSTSNLNYTNIPYSQNVSLVKSNSTRAKKKEQSYGRRKVRIQPKPDDVTFSVPDSLLSQTTCGVFLSNASSSPAEKWITLDGTETIHQGGEGTKPALSRQDLERLQVKRKQERMIRNRESACLSRKKKKEYVTHLEKQVEMLTIENSQLKLENLSLRERLGKFDYGAALHREKSKSIFSNSPRKTTALLALMVTVCVNLGSFSLLTDRGGISPLDNTAVDSDAHHSRTLLWADSELAELNTSLANVTQSCPMYINQTETIRLESELRRWIGADEDLTKTEKPKTNQYFDSSEKSTKHKSKPKRKMKMRLRKVQSPASAVDMYSLQPQLVMFDSLFEAIHRREDTFYLVSFSGDHLLLPALAHNKTSRPKMSLMLPTFLPNSSVSEVEMMQIDCEVTNTQLLSVKENDIPLLRHFVKYSNSSHNRDSRAEPPAAVTMDPKLVEDGETGPELSNADTAQYAKNFNSSGEAFKIFRSKKNADGGNKSHDILDEAHLDTRYMLSGKGNDIWMANLTYGTDTGRASEQLVENYHKSRNLLKQLMVSQKQRIVQNTSLVTRARRTGKSLHLPYAKMENIFIDNALDAQELSKK